LTVSPGVVLIFSAAARISSRFFGGLFGSSPAFVNASLLMYSSGIEVLNGIEYSFLSTV
jgi:hypothetical protein